MRRTDGGSGRGSLPDTELELAPHAVHAGDQVLTDGTAVRVIGGPRPGWSRKGRRVTEIAVRHPGTGKVDVLACDPAEPVTVRRPVAEEDGPRHLKVTAADGAVCYRTVHDEADRAAAVTGVLDAGGRAEETAVSGLEDAPAAARSLHKLAAARGWNTTWTSSGDRGGVLTAEHPDRGSLQVVQEWRNGRHLPGTENGSGLLRDSLTLIAANPGRVPGQTAGEIAAAKITGSRTPAETAADLPARQLDEAGLELDRRAALSGDGVTGPHQMVKDEAARRAMQDEPARVRIGAHAAEARRLAARLRSEYTVRAGLDRASMTPGPDEAHAQKMLGAARLLEEAAGQFEAGKEREAIRTTGKAARAADGIRDTALTGPPPASRDDSGTARLVPEEETARRIGDFHLKASRQLPLTDADGRQVRAGDTVRLLEGKHAGEKRAVTGADTQAAWNVPPGRIRLVRQAPGNTPAGPPRDPDMPDWPAGTGPWHAVTTDAEGRQGWHSLHDARQREELAAHAAEHALAVTAGEPGPGDLPRGARQFRDHALAAGWDVSAYKGVKPDGSHVHKVIASDPARQLKVTRDWEAGRAAPGSRKLSGDKRRISSQPRWEHVPGPGSGQMRRSAEFADALGDTGAAGHLEAAADAAAAGDTAEACAQLRAAAALVPGGRPESGDLQARIRLHLDTADDGNMSARARTGYEPEHGQDRRRHDGPGRARLAARARAQRASLAEACGITDPGTLLDEEKLGIMSAAGRDEIRDAEACLLRQDYDAADEALACALGEEQPPARPGPRETAETTAVNIEDARAVIRAAAARRRAVPPMLAAVKGTGRHGGDGTLALLAVDQKDREYQLWLDQPAGKISVTRAGQTLTARADAGRTTPVRAARELAGRITGEDHPVPDGLLPKPVPARGRTGSPGRLPGPGSTRQPVVDAAARIGGAGDRESPETRLHLDNAAAALAAGNEEQAAQHLAAARFAMGRRGDGGELARRIDRQRARLGGGALSRLGPGDERAAAAGTHDGVRWAAVERRPAGGGDIERSYWLRDIATGAGHRAAAAGGGPLAAASAWRREAARAEYERARMLMETARARYGETRARPVPDGPGCRDPELG